MASASPSLPSPGSGGLESKISDDEFLYIPSVTMNTRDQQTRSRQGGKRRRRLIFFITGNPGLVGYYHEFLSLIGDGLKGDEVVVYGRSLAGFEVSEKDTGEERGVVGLREQITISSQRLDGMIKRLDDHYHTVATNSIQAEEEWEWDVILIGHSVGSYIAMEMIRLLHHHQQSLSTTTTPFPVRYRIDLAILLTPTITHIAHSNSGRIFTPLLTYIPFLPTIAQLSAKFLTSLLPASTTRTLVSLVMGRTTPKAAVETTTKFLRSERGVKQALSMAGEEMKQIGPDLWGEEIWGSNPPSRVEEGGEGEVNEGTKLVLYFAKTDHWVDDKARDELIISRRRSRQVVNPTVLEERDGQTKSADEEEKEQVKNPSPTFIIEEKAEELVHGFCIRHSGFVARKVVGWVRERYS